jgi:hypothetical protein
MSLNNDEEIDPDDVEIDILEEDLRKGDCSTLKK